MSAKGGDRLTPFLAKIRDFLLQRKYNNSLRYADGWSKRTQPPCFLPEGANANIANNYYYMRDMRRNEVKKPDTIFEAGPKLLTESANLFRYHSGYMRSRIARVAVGMPWVIYFSRDRHSETNFA
ncbi:unnamed protein product [Dicrocoelium dendriticum]|nr:unnamed protein product [Dicrocoelium dendriticum]